MRSDHMERGFLCFRLYLLTDWRFALCILDSFKGHRLLFHRYLAHTAAIGKQLFSIGQKGMIKRQPGDLRNLVKRQLELCATILLNMRP